MDSNHLMNHEQRSQTGYRQEDASQPATSTAEPPASGLPGQLGPSVSLSFALQQALPATRLAMAVSTITEPEPPAPVDEQPVIVPVLSAQVFSSPVISPVIADPWEQVRDDTEIDDTEIDDTESAWVGDESVGAPETEDEDEAAAYAIDEMTAGRPYLRDDAFAIRERSLDGWKRSRKTALVMLGLALMVVLAVVGAIAAASYVGRATQHLSVTAPTPTVSTYSGGVVIQPDPENIAPTPEAAKYEIGAWMSSNSPTGGTVKVYVRVTHNVAPLAHIPVTLAVSVPGGTLRFGPTKTDAYGLARFTVRFGGISGTPVFVTARAKIGGVVYTADTVFVPI